MKKLLSIAAALVIAAVGVVHTPAIAADVSGSVSVSYKSATEADLADYANKVAVLVNTERRKNGLPELRVLPVLQNAAQKRADEITQEFAHTRPDGSSCFTVLEEYGLKYYYVGENIAAGQTSPENVMNAWMNSEGHRNNILHTEFMYIGVGVTLKNGRLYWSQLFLKYNDFPEAYYPTDKTEPQPSKEPKYGDLNSDGMVDGKDASNILVEYSAVSVGAKSKLSSEQKKYADVDANGIIDSKDASYVLGFYAYLSSGGSVTDIKKWMK